MENWGSAGCSSWGEFHILTLSNCLTAQESAGPEHTYLVISAELGYCSQEP